MQVYTGKQSGGRQERGQGMRVVLDVTEGLHGRNVTCNNYFSSYELARQLLKRKITVVGMVRKNKPELPNMLLAIKGRGVFSSKFAFTATTTLVSYMPKKNRNVLILNSSFNCWTCFVTSQESVKYISRNQTFLSNQIIIFLHQTKSMKWIAYITHSSTKLQVICEWPFLNIKYVKDRLAYLESLDSASLTRKY